MTTEKQISKNSFQVLENRQRRTVSPKKGKQIGKPYNCSILLPGGRLQHRLESPKNLRSPLKLEQQKKSFLEATVAKIYG